MSNVEKYFDKLMIAVSEDEIKYYTEFLQNHIAAYQDVLACDVSEVEELRYNFSSHVNVVKKHDTEIVDAELILKNVNLRYGNYVKVPKVVK